MGLCKDNASNYLNAHGYNVVRVPQAGIRPLLLIGQQKGSVAILGGLDRLITNPPESYPTVNENQRAAAIEGRESSKLDVSVGLGVLGTFLGALGGDVGVKASYAGAKTIQFRFQDVLMDRVMPLDVGSYLRDADVDVGNPVVEQYVLGRGRLYLITETIKSRHLTVMAERKGGGEAALNVPAIQAMMEGKLKVEVATGSASTLIFEGGEHLVFGFKALRVGVEDGVISLMSADASAVALSNSHPGSANRVTPVILSDEGLLDFAEEGELEA